MRINSTVKKRGEYESEGRTNADDSRMASDVDESRVVRRKQVVEDLLHPDRLLGRSLLEVRRPLRCKSNRGVCVGLVCHSDREISVEGRRRGGNVRARRCE